MSAVDLKYLTMPNVDLKNVRLHFEVGVNQILPSVSSEKLSQCPCRNNPFMKPASEIDLTKKVIIDEIVTRI